MSDLIERRKAIEAMGKAQWAKERLMELPSAQPDTKAQLSREDTTFDLISRQKAIDALGERPMVWTDDDQYALGERNQYDMNRLAIETLPSAQPEPCEDAVSRDSVKFLLCKETCHPGAFCPDGFCREICEKVDALPSATPKQRMGEWIPVSERLPEEDHWLGGSGKQFSDNVLISITNREDADAWSDISQTIDGEWGLELPRYCKITAWMPLPEPYRAERRIDGRD